MAQYVPLASSFKPSQVGALYHVGIGDGTNSYGYLFQPDPKVGMVERTNVSDKQALIQYSSPNLIDRDLVFWPRVTQGDYSGGGLQTILLNQNQYFDSDLEVRTPGLLNLRAAWTRTTLRTGVGTPTYQCVSCRGVIYTLFGDSILYKDNGTTAPTAPNSPAFLDSDGNVVLTLSVGGVYAYYDPGANTWSGTSNFGTAIQDIWYVNLGTTGRFIYSTPDGRALNKWDINQATNIAVPTGGQNSWHIQDIAPYQTGIAIATRGGGGGGPAGQSDIWYHDGQNLTRIVTIAEYDVVGITNCLGNLFVTATSTGQYEPPVLFMISSGSLSVVARPGSPLITASGATIGAPTTTGQYVYFTLGSPQINNVTPVTYIGVYDSVNEAYSHLPNFGTDDAPQVTLPRQLAASGRAIGFPMTSNAGNAVIQAQTNSTLLPSGNTYMSSGAMVSSKIDFSTPAIPKRFRRIEVQHAALTTGQSITVKAFVDQDPSIYTSSLTPVPSTATVTNSTVGSTTTILTFGSATVGKTLFYSLILNGPGSTTPQVQYVAVEVGGTWVWELTLDCTSKRRLLNGAGEDVQGVTGKDLYWLLRNAYENGTQLTLYLAENVSYTVQIETVDVFSPAYTDHIEDPVAADQEWQVHVILNQVA